MSRMKYMRKIYSILFLLIGFSLNAGDVSDFINLGFSFNGNYFMFAQKNVNVGKVESSAQAYIVDVVKNDYVSDGIFSYTESTLPELGTEGYGLIFNIVKENGGAIKKYGINHNNSGKSIYFLANGTNPESNLAFRIFDKRSVAKEINCTLHQTVNKETKKSSFYIDLKWVNGIGKSKSVVVGNPKIQRSGTGSYFIKNIISSPAGDSLIFVVAKEVFEGKDISIRYMVETVVLK